MELLDLEADQALLRGQVNGLVAAIYENERPLSGLAGLLDWRFRGAISRQLKTGAISGAPGECAYLPIARHGRTYHLVLAGAGQSEEPGRREGLPAETMRALHKNLVGLKLEKMGISRSDLGKARLESLTKDLKGAALCVLP